MMVTHYKSQSGELKEIAAQPHYILKNVLKRLRAAPLGRADEIEAIQAQIDKLGRDHQARLDALAAQPFTPTDAHSERERDALQDHIASGEGDD